MRKFDFSAFPDKDSSGFVSSTCKRLHFELPQHEVKRVLIIECIVKSSILIIYLEHSVCLFKRNAEVVKLLPDMLLEAHIWNMTKMGYLFVFGNKACKWKHRFLDTILNKKYDIQPVELCHGHRSCLVAEGRRMELSLL